MSPSLFLQEMSALADLLGDDERAVLVRIAERVAKGRAVYGALSIATDRRDFRAEAGEEFADAAFYLAVEAMRGG